MGDKRKKKANQGRNGDGKRRVRIGFRDGENHVWGYEHYKGNNER